MERQPIPGIQKITRNRIMATAMAGALIASGCSSVGEPDFRNGIVEAKRYEPERTWIQLIHVIIGKVPVLIPIFHRDDEDFVLTIRDCDEVRNDQQVCSSGDLYVTPGIYERTYVGDVVDFRKSDGCSTNDPIDKRRANPDEVPATPS